MRHLISPGSHFPTHTKQGDGKSKLIKVRAWCPVSGIQKSSTQSHIPRGNFIWGKSRGNRGLTWMEVLLCVWIAVAGWHLCQKIWRKGKDAITTCSRSSPMARQIQRGAAGPKQQVLPPHEKIHCCRMQTRGEVANCSALWQIESPKSGGGAGVEMTTGTYPPGTGMEAFFYPYTGTGNPTGKTYFFHN